MHRCVELARNGLGNTYPNPLVGCVIVNNDIIIGEGWHRQAGAPHAEVNAINSVKDTSQVKESTLYVNLEPCSHFGRTPPCADLIIASGIKTVVIGSLDPNPKVAGKGVESLKMAGCEVITNVCKVQCDELNKRFFTYHTKKRPYIILKWAQTNDGFIAPPMSVRSEIGPVWITNEFSRQLTHKLRSEEHGILVGTNTVLADNPSLTTRDWQGHSPERFILDRKSKIDQDAKVMDGKVETRILTESRRDNLKNTTFEVLDFDDDLIKHICDMLYRHEIQSLIVEGGAKTIQTFIDSNLWDEAMVFESEASFKEGVAAPKLSGQIFSKKKIKNDIQLQYKNTSL